MIKISLTDKEIKNKQKSGIKADELLKWLLSRRKCVNYGDNTKNSNLIKQIDFNWNQRTFLNLLEFHPEVLRQLYVCNFIPLEIVDYDLHNQVIDSLFFDLKILNSKFKHVEYRTCNMNYAFLSRDKFKKCLINECNFENAVFSQSHFEYSEFKNTDLCYSTFSQNSFNFTCFEHCYFHLTKINFSSFEDCIFENCNFVSTDLSDTSFVNCEFVNCKLATINFGCCSALEDITFIDCNLNECYWPKGNSIPEGYLVTNAGRLCKLNITSDNQPLEA